MMHFFKPSLKFSIVLPLDNLFSKTRLIKIVLYPSKGGSYEKIFFSIICLFAVVSNVAIANDKEECHLKKHCEYHLVG
ncbi:MAG: hypothetical protein ACI8PW_001951 [Methylophilaceae bacterium]|jgi:hypothetical protein